MKGKLKLHEIQTLQSNEKTAKVARVKNETIK